MADGEFPRRRARMAPHRDAAPAPHRTGRRAVTFAAVRRPKEGKVEGARELVSRDVVDRCKQGDERAWREFVMATQKDVYTLCLRILGEPDEAAEATQDAYLRMWRGLKGFRGHAKLSTWVYRVAANAAI